MSSTLLIPPHPSLPKPVLQGEKTLFALAMLAVISAGIYLAGSFLVPIVFAAFLSMLLAPLIHRMTRFIPHALAVLIAVVGLISAFVLIGWGSVSLLKALQRETPGYVITVKKEVDAAAKWLESHGAKGVQNLVDDVFDTNSIIQFAYQQDIRQRLVSLVGNTFGSVARFLASLGISLVVMIFILLEEPSFRGKCKAIRRSGGPDLLSILRTGHDIQHYLVVKMLIAVLTGLSVALLCAVFKLKYAFLWGVIAFLLNFLPCIGTLLVCIPAAIEAHIVHHAFAATAVVIGFAGLMWLLEFKVQAKLLGHRFNISSVIVMLSIIFWGGLWGLAGMLLAVPLTMLLKVCLDQTRGLEWIGTIFLQRRLGK